MAMYLDLMDPVIPGESKSPYGNWNNKIEIQHMGYDISSTTSMEAGTGLSSSGSRVGALSVTKVMDKSTYKLWYHLCSGTPISKMAIRVVRPGAAKNGQYEGLYEAETYQLGNVIVSSYSTSGSAGMGGLPTEGWSFSFTQITETYQEIDEKGNLKPPASFSYDFATATEAAGN